METSSCADWRDEAVGTSAGDIRKVKARGAHSNTH